VASAGGVLQLHLQLVEAHKDVMLAIVEATPDIVIEELRRAPVE